MTVRKGKGAKPTQPHRVRTRYRRVDKHDGVTYGDWYDQSLAEMGADQSTHRVNPPQEKSK